MKEKFGAIFRLQRREFCGQLVMSAMDVDRKSVCVHTLCIDLVGF